MKKSLLALCSMAILGTSAFAGGIVTNTNQSAAYVRMPAQDATLGIQAAYHNPAGLTHLDDGFHIQISNQSIVQKKEIESTHPFLNNKTYVGDVAAPLFPTVYAAYKTGKWAFSLGVNPIGGGGGAEYKTGLPSFEIPIASIPVGLKAAGVDAAGYSADIYFEGTSVYWGIQGGISYEVSDIASVYAGSRYVIAKNTYNGHIKDIQIGLGGNMTSATTFFTSIGQTEQALATKDAIVDVEQTGVGFSPILGANFTLMEDRLNIGMKYEFQTKMELENKITNDDVGMFSTTDGTTVTPNAPVPSDIPAMLSLGASYAFTDDFRAAAGFHYFWDIPASYGKRDSNTGEYANNENFFDKNSFEVSLGLEFDASEKITLSGGYLHSSSSPSLAYQTDLGYVLTTNTIALGLQGHITKALSIDFGVMYTIYQNSEKSFVGAVNYKELYRKDLMLAGIGVNYSFGGKKAASVKGH